jgi:hypothetical protein
MPPGPSIQTLPLNSTSIVGRLRVVECRWCLRRSCRPAHRDRSAPDAIIRFIPIAIISGASALVAAKVTATIRGNPRHVRCARRTKRTFVGTNMRRTNVLQRWVTLHTSGLHFQCHYLVSSNNSRPINMRRISLVPAPISYSLASRSSRPVG